MEWARAWIRSSRLKAVAEATERVHQRPVLVLSPSVGELLPLCHYDYMMLLIPRSKGAIPYSTLQLGFGRAKLDLRSHGGRNGERETVRQGNDGD